jgi:hypothetical protein
MCTDYVFSAATLGKWKQQARALKRSTALPHHQALDQVAIAKGFDNWHHVVTEAKLNLFSETAYRSGLVVAYDIKDAMDSWTPDDDFVDDLRVLDFCREDILAWYRRTDEEADEEERAATPRDPAEYQQDFQEWLNNVYFFRYCGPTLPTTPTKVLPLLSKRCFFAPMFIWFRGRFIEPFRDLAVDGVLDMSGNTEPISDNATLSEDDALGS